MRNIGRFLRASWGRSLDSVGRVDLVVGLVATLAGRLMNVDLALLAVVVVLLVLVVRVLVLSPAAMWAAAEAERHRPDAPSVVGSVEAGGVVNIYLGTGTFSIPPTISAATVTTRVDGPRNDEPPEG